MVAVGHLSTISNLNNTLFFPHMVQMVTREQDGGGGKPNGGAASSLRTTR
jgi:hypothetical protein